MRQGADSRGGRVGYSEFSGRGRGSTLGGEMLRRVFARLGKNNKKERE